ncbi:hypothetical protein FEM48_Zijuj08G0056400 [Ziziphus jujuba var. spinosa]|uniref:Uncharacterized protein n=1 Tax=Ziziphus jujuba var. spinosa TaxID=714518 RepID=A0A978UXA4_ZIZJJ|nr:hypothetical protein FEM48_Zijuj08G0056400 [Ziziphus jujuba var. spinosa]
METGEQQRSGPNGGYLVGRHSNASLKRDLMIMKRKKTANQRLELQELSSWMPWHTAFALLNPLLIGVLQVKCQGALVSPFETHTRAIWTFLVSTLIYSFSFAAGSLSSISLLSVLLPPLFGSLIFFLWIIVPLIVLHQLIKQSYGRLFQWMAIEAGLSFVLNIWNSSGILDWSRGSVVSSNSDTIDGRSDHESIVEVVPEREEEEKRGDVILDGESNINVQLNECGSYDVEGENKNKEGTSDGESKDVETNECGNYETKGEDEDTEVMLDGDTKDMQWGNYKVDGLRWRKNMTRPKGIWSDEVEIADMKILKPYSYGWEWRLPSFTDSLVFVTLTKNVFESFTELLSLFGCSLFSNNDEPKHQNGHEISTPLNLDTRQIHFYRYSTKNNQKWPWICWCWGYNRYVDGVELKIFLEGGEFGERHQREDQKDGDDYSHYERKKVVFPLPRKGQLLGGRQRKPRTK